MIANWEQVRHQVAIAGVITDVQSRMALAGAWVIITDGPQEFKDWLARQAQQYGASWAAAADWPDRKRTARDGLYYFIDLPNGPYTLRASLPDFGTRYGTAQIMVNVSRDANGNVARVAADIVLSPTTLKGQVTGKNNAAVVMARVRVGGSGEMTLTDDQGAYVLAGIEAGNRTITVSVPGYQPATQAVALTQPGVVQTSNISLTPKGP